MRVRLVVLAALALALAGLVPALASEEHRGPALHFQQAEISTTLEDLRKGVRLDIHNDRARDLTARLRISELGLKAPGAAGAAVPTAKTVLFPTEVDVAAAGTQQVTIKAPEGAEIANGVYRGQLSVFEPETDSVARIPFVLSVGKPKLAVPKPAVKKLTIRVVRWVPWGDDAVDVRDPYLPLAIPGDTAADKIDLAKDNPLGLLPGDQRRVVEVTYSGKTKELSKNVGAVELGVLNAGRPGEYSGTIDTLPDAEGGNVDISVITTDSIWIAILPLLAGIALALWLRHWQGAGRTGILLGHQEAMLRSAFRQARAQFKRTSAGRAWEEYDTGASFAAETAKLREDLAELLSHSFDQLDEETQEAIEKRLEALRTHADALPGFASDLAALDEALDEVEELGPVESLHDEDSPDVPVFVTNARKLLKGRTLTIAEFATVSGSVDDAMSLAERWPRMHAEATRAAARLARFDDVLSGLPEDDRRLVNAARQALAGVWVQLWEAEDAQAVVDAELAQNLVRALTLVAQLTAVPDRPAVRETLGESVDALEAGEPIDISKVESILPPTAGRTLRDADTDPAERAKQLAAAIRRGDRWRLGLAASIALYSGLQALYFGKVFGDTPADYLAALLWGITTAGAVDLIAEALRSRLGGVFGAGTP